MTSSNKYDRRNYNSDICFSDNQDEPILRNLKIICPKCNRQFAALISKFTKKIRLSNTVSEESPNVIYDTTCSKCKTKFTFSVSWN